MPNQWGEVVQRARAMFRVTKNQAERGRAGRTAGALSQLRPVAPPIPVVRSNTQAAFASFGVPPGWDDCTPEYLTSASRARDMTCQAGIVQPGPHGSTILVGLSHALDRGLATVDPLELTTTFSKQRATELGLSLMRAAPYLVSGRPAVELQFGVDHDGNALIETWIINVATTCLIQAFEHAYRDSTLAATVRTVAGTWHWLT